MKEDRAYLIYITESIANLQDLTATGRDAFLAAKHNQAAALYYLQTNPPNDSLTRSRPTILRSIGP